MRCPACSSSLRTVHYEGVEVETCGSCHGEWLDAHELNRIIELREKRFDPEAKRAIAASKPIPGVPIEEIQRIRHCPKCSDAAAAAGGDGASMAAINYGADTGIIIDRCPDCRGVWLDGEELEKVQMLLEQWDDELPATLAKYGPVLRRVETDVEGELDLKHSNLPWVGRWINTLVNGILDFSR